MAAKILLICLVFHGLSCASPSKNANIFNGLPVQNGTYNELLDLDGGLYGHGSNTRPPEWEAHLLKHCRPTRLMPDGYPDVNGKVGLLGLGFSTAAMTFTTAAIIMDYQQPFHPFIMVNGAQGGKDINHMGHRDSEYWQNVLFAVDSAGIGPLQVQVIWMSTGDLQAYSQNYMEYSRIVEGKYIRVIEIAKELFPNLKLVLLSDRTYGGYITSEAARNLGEPSGYFHTWVTRELIRKQIEADSGWQAGEMPAIDWGPVLWTNGDIGDLYGYRWMPEDAGEGGIHPSAKGRVKEGVRLYLYLLSHPAINGLYEKESTSQ